MKVQRKDKDITMGIIAVQINFLVKSDCSSLPILILSSRKGNRRIVEPLDQSPGFFFSGRRPGKFRPAVPIVQYSHSSGRKPWSAVALFT